MEYLKVEWVNHNPKCPVEIYSELDNDRWETRKVEVFADGHLDYSDGFESTGHTGLSEVPMPGIEEIEPQNGLTPTVISQEQFEAVWRNAGGPTAT